MEYYAPSKLYYLLVSIQDVKLLIRFIKNLEVVELFGIFTSGPVYFDMHFVSCRGSA